MVAATDAIGIDTLYIPDPANLKGVREGAAAAVDVGNSSSGEDVGNSIDGSNQHPQRLAHRISFSASDCLTGAAGSELESAAPEVDLFTFNYVCVENAKALRADKFKYLKRVFAAAKAGAIFCFQDSSYHLWEEIAQCMGNATTSGTFEVLHPRSVKSRPHRHLNVWSVCGLPISVISKSLCQCMLTCASLV